jgi:hypothetical protein
MSDFSETVNLKLPVPALRGFFGDRLATYVTQAKPNDLISLLGHDPRSKNWRNLPEDTRSIYEFLQRKTAKSRRDSIGGYIDERMSEDALVIGAFPAVSLAFREPLEFIQSETSSGVGRLMIDVSPSAVRILLDGLGRVTGALDLREEGYADLLNRFVFPVTIYAPKPGEKPLSYKEMGQLFHDMNFRVQPVSKNHAIALDTSDSYIALANRLAESPVIVDNGGVAERAASLGKKSTELVVQTVLVRFLRGATEGRRFQESNLSTVPTPNLTRESRNPILVSVEGFLTAFADEMGDVFKSRDSLHLTSPGWQALGVLHHDARFKLKMSEGQVNEIARLAARIDWSRYNPDWIPMLGQPEVDKVTGAEVVDAAGRPRVSITGSGRYNVQMILDYLRAKAGISDTLKAIGADIESVADADQATDTAMQGGEQ